jgi:magnesium-transporting ATPase (P-type)
MLWVNLIMDTFASLALATEPPSNDVLNKPPYGKRENIVNAIMYRTIIGQSVYQICVLCFVLFGLQHLIDVESPLSAEVPHNHHNARKPSITLRTL